MTCMFAIILYTCVFTQQSPVGSIRCECHVKVVDKTAKRAKIKLVLASIIALGFMAGEVVGKNLK